MSNSNMQATTTSLAAQAAGMRAQLTGPGAPFELQQLDVAGQRFSVYKNAFTDLPALIQAGRAHAAREFIVYEGERWTFERFFAAADALAARLQQQGLVPGARVAIAMRNRPEWAVAFVATVLAGAVPAPLNSFGLRDELLANLRDVQPAWLICDAERHAHVGADLAALRCRALVVDAPAASAAAGATDWQLMTAAANAPALQPVAVQPDDLALILFTSGASSQAKGVLSSHRSVCQALFNIDYIGAISAMTSPEIVAKVMARGLQPTTLTAVPLFHVSGLHAQLLTALRHGRRLVFMRRWEPVSALALMQAEKITQFNGAPAMVGQLLAQPSFAEVARDGCLGGVGFGGAGLPQSLIDAVLSLQRDSMSGIGFGMTESNGVGSAASGRLFAARPEASGLVSPIIDVRIADFDGQPMPVGEPGEIWLRGVSVMQGYLNQPEGAEAALRGGWLRTGDIGVLDADGYLRVVDRIKDVINRAGEKISAAEVESCLLQHAAIEEAAVFGQADELTGEAVVAVLVIKPGWELDAVGVQQHVRERLAAYKVPAAVHLRTEQLPRNPAGKMLKSALKKLYAVH
ncbi:class I adenylate-forming enzyme family protein [Roseateles sp. PN1]|uniref:class I adenylate-forming enzyme family protein n=1 Tax=Roseateles sp. PN1 TaxID=3137372 RepID=UPI003138B98C